MQTEQDIINLSRNSSGRIILLSKIFTDAFQVALTHYYMFGLKHNCSHVLPQDSKCERVNLCRTDMKSVNGT